MTIPLEDPERLTYDILPVVTVSLRHLPFQVMSVLGTGFLLGDGFLVSSSHCIGASPPEGTAYSVVRLTPPQPARASPVGFREDLGHDLAWARVNYRAALGFQLASHAPRMGTSVWTFGYPFPQGQDIGNGLQQHTVHPRVLHGYITRAFVYQHGRLGPIPSWELSFPTPEGLSGSPLFLDDTLDVVGVIYGNNDVGVVDEFASIDPETGTSRPEIQRIMSFGLAHHLSILQPLTERATTFTPTNLID